MIEDLVLRNSTSMDFQITFIEATHQGYIKKQRSDFFLLGKNYRTFKTQPGKISIKFLYMKNNSKELFVDLISPGFYDIKFLKGDSDLTITNEKITLNTLHNKIINYFGDLYEYTYDINNSRFKDISYEKKKDDYFLNLNKNPNYNIESPANNFSNNAYKYQNSSGTYISNYKGNSN